MFVISLAGIIVQDVYAFIIANGIEVWGMSSAILPAIVLLFGVGLILYSRSAQDNDWID